MERSKGQNEGVGASSVEAGPGRASGGAGGGRGGRAGGAAPRLRSLSLQMFAGRPRRRHPRPSPPPPPPGGLAEGFPPPLPAAGARAARATRLCQRCRGFLREPAPALPRGARLRSCPLCRGKRCSGPGWPRARSRDGMHAKPAPRGASRAGRQ